MSKMTKIHKYYRGYNIYETNETNETNDFIREFSNKTDFDDFFKYIHSGLKNSLYINDYKLSSSNGWYSDCIENITRLLPLIALKINENKDGNRDELLCFYRDLVMDGTDKKSKRYWGDACDYDQIICEMSDVCISIYILEPIINDVFTSVQLNKIKSWLYTSIGKKTSNNNWIIFSLTIEIMLKRLDIDIEISKEKYDLLKTWYQGDGFFRDGKDGSIDYYSFWGFSYGLFWINEMLPDFDSYFILDVINSASDSLKLLIDDNGMPPFFGRSISYRLAFLCPLIISAKYNNKEINYAGTILKKTYTYFSNNHSFKNGKITSGFHDEDYELVDNYSGSSSCLWSLRSFILSEYLFIDGVDLYNSEVSLIKNQLIPGDIVSLANDNILISKNNNVIFLENKTIEIPHNDKKTIKKIIKKTIKKIIYQRKDRNAKRPDNINFKITSENNFYKKEQYKT